MGLGGWVGAGSKKKPNHGGRDGPRWRKTSWNKCLSTLKEGACVCTSLGQLYKHTICAANVNGGAQK